MATARPSALGALALAPFVFLRILVFSSAEESLVKGRKRGEKTALLSWLRKLAASIDAIKNCQTSTCSQQLASVRVAFKSLSRHVPPEQYREAQRQIFERGVSFAPEKMGVSFLEASRSEDLSYLHYGPTTYKVRDTTATTTTTTLTSPEYRRYLSCFCS